MIEQERWEVFLHSLEKDLRGPLRELEETAKREKVPIVRRSMQSLLRFLMESHRPEQILEIGTAVGFSALLMREYAPETAQITTIEKVPEKIIKAKENFARLDPDHRIGLLEGDAADLLPFLVKEGKHYDFIFMDAAKGQYPHFLNPVKELLLPGGLLVTDNVLQEGTILDSRYTVDRRDRTIHKRMRDYLYALMQDEELSTVILPAGDGAAVSYKKETGKKDE